MTGLRRRRRSSSAGLFATDRLFGVCGGGAGHRGLPGLAEGGREEPTVPRPIGIRDALPVLVEIVIDESPSEYDVDPLGHRHVAARRIVELLRTDLAHPGDRVAVVHFAERAVPRTRPQDPHTRRGHRRLRRALRPQGAGPTTDIRGALAAAARLVPRRRGGSVVVVLLTDGQDGSTTEQLEAAVERLPPRSVHLLSIGEPVPETWDEVSLGSATVVPTATRPDAVEWAVARLLYRGLGLSWPHVLDPEPAGSHPFKNGLGGGP